MNARVQEHRGDGLVIGFVTGTLFGAGLAIWLAPRLASEVQRMAHSARSLGERASEQYQQASTKVGDAVDDLTRKGQAVRDGVAEAVARGAHEVERYATAVTDGSKHSAADRHTS